MTADDGLRLKRAAMIEGLKQRGITDPRVLHAMNAIPRERFVAEKDRARSYGDHAIAIDADQTISQPYMVAVMTQLLRLQPADHVLEIGTGSGYQTAVLAEIAGRVSTVERITRLSHQAQTRLRELGYDNIDFYVANGAEPFGLGGSVDAIIVTAASNSIPAYLTELVKEHGLVVAPIGPSSQQQLITAEKRNGVLRQVSHFGCRFVPLLNQPPDKTLGGMD